jgi:hypothetical protein
MYGISEQFLRKFGGHGIAREEMGCLFRGRADLPPFVEGLGWETKSNGTHWRVVIAGPVRRFLLVLVDLDLITFCRRRARPTPRACFSST